MIKKFLLTLGLLAALVPSARADFSPIITCPGPSGPTACIFSTYVGLQYPDGTIQTTAASSPDALSIGLFDTGTPSINGAQAVGEQLILQSASSINPGLVNISNQTFSGLKSFAAPTTGPNFQSGLTNVTGTGGTTALAAGTSTRNQSLIGTLSQTFQLPTALNLIPGAEYTFSNNSTGLLQVTDFTGTSVGNVQVGGKLVATLLNNSTPAGVWNPTVVLPGNYSVGTAGAVLPGFLTLNGDLTVFGGAEFASITLPQLTPSQLVATDSSLNLVSIPYSVSNTVSNLVQRDSSGGINVGAINVAALSASQVVTTDTSKNLQSTPYATGGTPSTLALRDTNGDLAANDFLATNNVATNTLTATDTIQSDSTVTADIALITGKAGTSQGSILMNGSISGTVSIQTQDAAGTYPFNLPTTAGTAGQVLTSQGGGSNAMTWTTPSGGSSSPPVRQIFSTAGSGNITVPTPVPRYGHLRAVGGGGASDGSGSGAGSGSAGGTTTINSGQITLTGGNPGGNNGGAVPGGNCTVNAGSLTVQAIPFQGGNSTGVPVPSPWSGSVMGTGGVAGASIFGTWPTAGSGTYGQSANTIGSPYAGSAGSGAGGGVDALITGGFTAGMNIPYVVGTGGTGGGGGSGGYGSPNGAAGMIVIDWYY